MVVDTKDKDKKQVILQTSSVSDVFEIKADANHCFVPYANTMQLLSTFKHGDINTIDKNNYFLKLKHTKSTRKREREDVYYSDDLFKNVSKINNLKTQPINGFYQNNGLKRVKLKDATKHFTSVITAHGDTYRSFSLANGNKNNLIKKHFDGISDESFQQLDSLFIKSEACCGGYYDEDTSIFDEIQTKLKKCKGEAPKCFVRLVKKDYVLAPCHMYNEEEQKWEIKDIPLSNKKDKPVIYEELYTNKDKYFDYYYVTPNAVYKVDHELVHNRVDLIEKGEFDKEWRKHKKKKCFKGYDFKEFHDYKHLKSLRDMAPEALKDFY